MDKHISIEQDILGSIILDNNLIIEAINQGIIRDMFHSIQNKVIWDIFTQLQREGSIIDLSTIIASHKGDLKEIGGITYLSNIAGGIATLQGFKDYIKILIKRYQKQKVKELGAYLNNNTESVEPDELINHIQQKTMDILRLSSNETKDKAARYEEYTTLKYKVKFKEIEASYSTGFKRLDDKLGGMKKGNYITLVSGSGVGKTTLAVNMAYRMAKRGYKVVFYSIEMTEVELLDKINALSLDIDYKKITNVDLSDEELHLVESNTFKLTELPLTIVQDITSTEDLLNDIMYRTLTNSVQIVFVDYLQLYCDGSKGNNLSEKLGDLTINLKKLSQRNRIVTIALAQANREAHSRIKDDDASSFLLTQKDIQDSGRIFQNSNIVLGIARNITLDDEDAKKALVNTKLLNYNKPDLLVNPEFMIVQVLKNRGGTIGNVGLKYYGRYSKIDNFY